MHLAEHLTDKTVLDAGGGGPNEEGNRDDYIVTRNEMGT